MPASSPSRMMTVPLLSAKRTVARWMPFSSTVSTVRPRERLNSTRGSPPTKTLTEPLLCGLVRMSIKPASSRNNVSRRSRSGPEAPREPASATTTCWLIWAIWSAIVPARAAALMVDSFRSEANWTSSARWRRKVPMRVSAAESTRFRLVISSGPPCRAEKLLNMSLSCVETSCPVSSLKSASTCVSARRTAVALRLDPNEERKRVSRASSMWRLSADMRTPAPGDATPALAPPSSGVSLPLCRV